MTENSTVEKYNGPSPQTIRIECAPGETKKKSGLRKFFGKFLVVVLILSLLVNVYIGYIISQVISGPFSARPISGTNEDQVVAVFSIDGVIDAEQSYRMEQFYRFVRDTKKIKAVLLHVASPGGTINDSEKIYQQVLRIKNELNRPVAVYMDGVAASGGYYVSAAADKIFARRTTITGSIGVIAMYPALRGLLEDKLGVKVITVRSRQATANKARPSGLDVPEDRIMLKIQDMLDTHQEQFNNVVTSHREVKTEEIQREIVNAAGEKQTITEVRPFNGEVFLAEEAKELNLIDEVGELEDAVKFLTTKAALNDPQVIRYSVPPTLAEALGLPTASLRIDENFLENVTSLRMLYLWKAN